MIRWAYRATDLGAEQWWLHLIRLRADGQRDGRFGLRYCGTFTPSLAQQALNAPGYHAYLAEVFNEQQAWACRAGLAYIARRVEEV